MSDAFLTAVNAAACRALDEPFEWGKADCCTFACDIVREATGRDLMAPLRGRYDSEAGAKAVMGEFGGQGIVSVAEAMAQAAGLRPASFPWSGNLIGVVPGWHGPLLAVFAAGSWVARGPKSVVRMAPHYAVMAWHVEAV